MEGRAPTGTGNGNAPWELRIATGTVESPFPPFVCLVCLYVCRRPHSMPNGGVCVCVGLGYKTFCRKFVWKARLIRVWWVWSVPQKVAMIDRHWTNRGLLADLSCHIKPISHRASSLASATLPPPSLAAIAQSFTYMCFKIPYDSVYISVFSTISFHLSPLVEMQPPLAL